MPYYALRRATLESPLIYQNGTELKRKSVSLSQRAAAAATSQNVSLSLALSARPPPRDVSKRLSLSLSAPPPPRDVLKVSSLSLSLSLSLSARPPPRDGVLRRSSASDLIHALDVAHAGVELGVDEEDPLHRLVPLLAERRAVRSGLNRVS